MADLSEKVSCTYCQEEINSVRVQCCECPDFDICLQCFAVGAEIGPHKNDHPYKFVDHCTVCIFGGRGAWTGREHLRLLEAAELFSYGNWDWIAKIVETRTAEECKEEFIARYINGNIGKATWANIPRPILYTDIVEDEGPLSPAALAKLAPLDATPEEARVLGYKPQRDDFEGEYNPEAEHLVSDLQLQEQDETDMEKGLKLAIIDMYVRRLRERQRRKRIVRDYQLVAKYFDNLRRDPSKPLYPQAEKELREGMRPLAQFLNSGEHERLIASMNRERELRQRLTDLKKYRSLGLTTQEEIIHYEQHMAFQKQQIRQGKVGCGGSAKVPSTSPHLTSENGAVGTSSNSTEERTTWLSENDSGYGSAAGPPPTSVETSPGSVIWTPPTINDKNPADLRALPMGRLLNREEIDLCIWLNLQPVTYSTLKSLLIEDHCLNPGKYDYITKIEPDSNSVNVRDKLVRYLHDCGLLTLQTTDA